MKPSYFISVGEPSGDLLASELLSELQKQIPDYQAFGIAGPKLAKNPNYIQIADISELAVMGFVEVIKHLTYLKRLEDFLIEEIEKRQPKFAILVDYPGFNLRLAEFLQARNIKVIQYVAPQLWAWGEKRTVKLRALTDLVLGIMPFEQDFFLSRNVRFEYVGTPQVDRAQQATIDREGFHLPQGICIGFFPGSRRGEVSRMLPMIANIRDEILRLNKEIKFAISISPSVPIEIFDDIAGCKIPSDLGSEGGVFIHESTSFVRGRSLDLMASVDSAMVTSGTATLECGLVNTPLCVAYRMNGLSFTLAKYLVKLKYISLVNLVADQEIIKEFVQEFTPLEVAAELLALAMPGKHRQTVLDSLHDLHSKVSGQLAVNAARKIADFSSSI